MPNNGAILAPVAIGELIDKITILEIKAERIADPGKLRNVGNELAGLRAIRSQAGLDRADMEPHARELKVLNRRCGRSRTNSASSRPRRTSAPASSRSRAASTRPTTNARR